MNASRAALMVVGVNLVAVWAAAAAGSRTAMAEPAVPPPVMAEEGVGEARASLLAAAERLEAHARRNVKASMSRDPFRFGVESRPAGGRQPHAPPSASPAEALASPTPAVDPDSDIVLQGMAETADGETVVRTAILRAGTELVLASVGTRVAGRYDVVAITADSVELEDTVTRVRRTWRMK